MQGGVGIADVAKHADGIAVLEIAEIGSDGRPFSPNAVAAGALKFVAGEQGPSVFPVAGLQRCGAAVGP